MAFEADLRNKISAAPFGSVEKNILKVVLGEFQLKATLASVTDEAAYGIVKKLIKGNEETIARMSDTDSRKQGLISENKIMVTLLPQYLSEVEIRQYLESGGLFGEIRGAKNEGVGIGMASKYLKTLNKPFENETVRKVIVSLRA